MKNLVIVESPSKSKTIEKYLGGDYHVVSSKGHIRDLATTGKGGLGIDVENGFIPNYKITFRKVRWELTLRMTLNRNTSPSAEKEIFWQICGKR